MDKVLSGEEALQASDPPQFLNLSGDACLQFAVPLGDLVGPLSQFAQEPCILDRDHRLCREILQQRDLLVGERSDLLADCADETDQCIVLAQRHQENSSCTRGLDRKPE